VQVVEELPPVVPSTSLDGLGETVSLAEAGLFAAALAAGLALIYALLLALVTLSFWFVRVENLMVVFWSFTDAGRFPVQVYPGWLRYALSTVVPIGVAVTVPSQAVAGKVGAGTVGLLILGALVAWAAASAFWRLGLRSYTGASA